MFAQHFREGGLSCADITGYCNVFWFFQFRHMPVPCGY
jgi:hypothetical protein